MAIIETILFSALVGFILIEALSITATRLQLFTLLVALACCLMVYSTGRSIVLPVACLAFVVLLWRIYEIRTGPAPRQRYLRSGLLLVAFGIAVLPLLLLKPAVQFPPLEGEHSVGVRDAIASDPDRGMAWNAVDEAPRQFVVRIWYPSSGSDETVFSQRNSEAEKSATYVPGFNAPSILGEALTRTQTNAQRDARITAGKFPLLIYSHGYAGQIYANSLLMEQLASHGYIVLSLSHPGESSFLVDPNGDHVPQSDMVEEMFAEHAATNLFEAFDLSPSEKYTWGIEVFEPIQMVSERLDLWALDFISVVDALQDRNVEGDIEDILDAIDFERIGYLGMSAGGGSSAAACHIDTRCGGSVSLDGGIGTPSLRNRLIRNPALIMDGGYPTRLAGQDLYFEPHESFNSHPDIYRLTFPYNGHSDFTDFALVLSKLGKIVIPPLLPVLGPVDGTATQLIQSRLTSSFFDRYLKQQGPENFPDDLVSDSAIVTAIDPEPLRIWANAH